MEFVREPPPQVAGVEEGEPQEMGWGILVVFVAINLIIGFSGPTLRGGREAVAGDPASLRLGLGSAWQAAALLAASRNEDRSILFRLLNSGQSASYFGWFFLIPAVFLLGRYVGII